MTLQASVAKRTLDNITVVVIAFNFMGETAVCNQTVKIRHDLRKRELSEDQNLVKYSEKMAQKRSLKGRKSEEPRYVNDIIKAGGTGATPDDKSDPASPSESPVKQKNLFFSNIDPEYQGLDR